MHSRNLESFDISNFAKKEKLCSRRNNNIEGGYSMSLFITNGF